jgi:hypothetical protein
LIVNAICDPSGEIVGPRPPEVPAIGRALASVRLRYQSIVESPTRAA